MGKTLAEAEWERLRQSHDRTANWQRWGPYLSERQWGTVREDYSADGTCWDYFPHDHARSRAYRWGEDGLLGITDRECRLCFAVALWNGRDPILKERLFGLTGPEGNHGEDVKECYYYLDSSPTHAYMKGLYKYPQGEFPYTRLVEEARRRGVHDPEFELADTGVFDENRYFDIFVEYAKGSPNDILIRIRASNRGPEAAELHLLPTFWFRNTWSWGCEHEGCWPKPRIWQEHESSLWVDHVALRRFQIWADAGPDGRRPPWLFTENETNFERLFGVKSASAYRKDAFHEYVIGNNAEAVSTKPLGTKTAAHYILKLQPGETQELRLRLAAEPEAPREAFGPAFEKTFQQRIAETDAFYGAGPSAALSADQQMVRRQAYAGLLWTKQFYHYVVDEWMKGDPDQPPVAPRRKWVRNSDWSHLFNRDVISMPDKWEYPWYAAWDLAFHMIPFCRVDPEFSKAQLLLFLREWYMHPNGQMPAYEFAFSDVNPPVHAWACWRVYKMTGPKGGRDLVFLERVFQKLLLNFTWWVNRKDVHGKHLFAGGFLGLDNIGLFDRSKPLPTGGHLEQADGTAWMAFYCVTMLAMSLELADQEPAYEDMASKFFEHFVAIADAMNALDGSGLWSDADGFYYDHLLVDGRSTPLRIRSMVGIIPLFAVGVLDDELISRLPGFRKRMEWFLKHRMDLSRHITYMETDRSGGERCEHRLLAIPARDRLERVLRYVLDENEFLSPYGIRSLSRVHQEHPFVFQAGGEKHCVEYVPGESTTWMFGGNSNWRGPVWFPLNFLLIESLEQYHYFYGDTFRVECPVGSGRHLTLLEVACELRNRLAKLFMADADGRRPCHGDDSRYASDDHWRELVLFHEYFHGEHGRGLGASHQTGWTALIAGMLEDTAQIQG